MNLFVKLDILILVIIRRLHKTGIKFTNKYINLKNFSINKQNF